MLIVCFDEEDFICLSVTQHSKTCCRAELVNIDRFFREVGRLFGWHNYISYADVGDISSPLGINCNEETY